MPGLHISDQQVLLFMTHRRHHTQAVAASKAGISERSDNHPGLLVELTDQVEQQLPTGTGERQIAVRRETDYSIGF